MEDKLQVDVKSILELLRNAGIKIWTLTGDRFETTRCIAISTKLVVRNQYMHEMSRSMSCLSVFNLTDFFFPLILSPDS